MEKKKCYVTGCSTVGGRLYRIPINVERAEVWWRFCMNPILDRYELRKLHNSFQICIKHFATDAFTYPSSEVLLRSAKPTLFPPTVHPVQHLTTSAGPTTSSSSDNEPLLPIADVHEPPQTPAPPAALSSSPVQPQHTSSLSLLLPSPCDEPQSSSAPPATLPSSPDVPPTTTMKDIIATPKRKRLRTPILHSIGVTRVSQLTPRKKILAADIVKCRQKLQRLKKLSGKYRKDIQGLSDITKSDFMVSVESSLSPAAMLLVKSIIKQDQVRPKGRRWTHEEKVMALSLFKKGPKTYRFLKNFIPLPVKSTLVSLLKTIPLKTGISREIFAHLRSAVEKLENKNKYCALLFD
ncbi:uncharacterized protein LOC124172621 [Ischnura elegans]|uniref:uncharacterized protein LOC124172621 n=1 Tax=Ischnura elegans TaxID=197161 RepID=UPI001ED88A49|nr:uncharacterized protein LOC124172621 [Ischnura elegans]